MMDHTSSERSQARTDGSEALPVRGRPYFLDRSLTGEHGLVWMTTAVGHVGAVVCQVKWILSIRCIDAGCLE